MEHEMERNHKAELSEKNAANRTEIVKKDLEG